MPAKRGLGRGLDALFPVSESTAGVTQVPLSAVSRNPRQPRMRYDPAELEDLATSIREHGVIQPLVVTQSAYPGQYTLIAGERRLEAARLAGLPTVPAIIREASDEQMLELALVENVQRTDLGPFETATAYKHLAEDFGLSHDEIAAKVGVTKGSLYWHFKSKKEVILAAAAIYYRDWQRQAYAAIAAASDPLEQLRGVLRMSIHTCLFDRAKRLFSTELFALSLQDAEVRASWSQFYDTVRELFVGLVEAACRAEIIQTADPAGTADLLLSAFEGVKHRASFQPQICTAEERDRLVAGLMRFLAARAGAA